MEDTKKELLHFLKSQKLLVIASQGKSPWITNVYFGVDDDFKLYFVSPKEAKHSKHMLESPTIAFSIAWFNPENHKDRKAIQGRGICRIAESEKEIETGVSLHNTNFPEFKEKITLDWIKDPENSDVWVIEPFFMKFWNDELYGENGTDEFGL